MRTQAFMRAICALLAVSIMCAFPRPARASGFFGGASVNSAALDAVFGSTRGVIPVRGVSGWTVIDQASAFYPLVSGGPGGEPAFIPRLLVPAGGTGASTFTTHGVVVGEGTNTMGSTSAGTSGQVLTSNGAAADPTFQTFAGSSLSATLGVGASTGNHNITFTAGDSIQTSGTDVLYIEGTPLAAFGSAADGVLVVNDTRTGSAQGHGGGIVLSIHNATYSYFGGGPQVTLKCWKETGTVNDAATFGVATTNGGGSDDSIKFAVDSTGDIRSSSGAMLGWTSSGTDATPGTALDASISRNSSASINFGDGSGTASVAATLNYTDARMQGRVRTYNTVTTAGNGVGSIVAQFSRAAQTSSDANLLTFTPSADGSYLISPNLTVTATAVGLSMSVAYTDQNSVSRTQTLAFLNSGGSFVNALTSTGSYEGASVRIRIKGGTAITVSSSITSGTYDEECDIEWLK